jgi:hypothetical protein
MTDPKSSYVFGNARNSHVKVSLADHDELLYSDFIVKFKHDPTGKDDLRDHIQSAILVSSRILVAGNQYCSREEPDSTFRLRFTL